MERHRAPAYGARPLQRGRPRYGTGTQADGTSAGAVPAVLLATAIQSDPIEGAATTCRARPAVVEPQIMRLWMRQNGVDSPQREGGPGSTTEWRLVAMPTGGPFGNGHQQETMTPTTGKNAAMAVAPSRGTSNRS